MLGLSPQFQFARLSLNNKLGFTYLAELGFP
jgi:hypothetical protein